MAKKRRSGRLTPQRATQKQKTPLWIWLAIGSVALVLMVVGLFYLGNQGINAAGSNIDGVEILPDPGQGHQEGEIDYAHDAPVGGAHNSAWQNCGIYDESIREENAVHSLEHGAVWVTYQPDLPEDQVELLRDLVRQERRNRGEAMVLLSPKPDIASPIVATAWRVRLSLEDASDERLPEFLSAYQRGPFTPEPGATCANGVGTPIS